MNVITRTTEMAHRMRVRLRALQDSYLNAGVGRF